ncbi:MAG: endolytic transglycosylase MltG [Pseudomonadales bacterium]|nr:endolytic transglycosylase MltG [Pseudomonadales bacterium]
MAPGAGANAVIQKLAQEGILQRPLVAKLALRYFEPRLVLKVGEYQLPATASRAQLFELFASGVSVQYPVTLVEGFSVAEALAAVTAQRASVGLSSLNNGASTWQVDQLARLLSDQARQLMRAAGVAAPEGQQVEGWFFPDTYHVAKSDSVADIFTRAHRKMLEVLTLEWSQRQPNLPYNSPYEALIMASLIEKETGAIEEREAIAGVFVRRLQKGMRLQTDPTVIYGLGSTYEGNLRRKHLLADTPYNTYTRHGLPPTPIALPGRGAIRAALNPAEGDALYFVAKGDGRHHFSATFAEHQRAVQQYQIQNRRSDYRSSPKAGAG